MSSVTFTHPVLAVHAAPATSPVSVLLMKAAVAVATWETRARTRNALRDLTGDQLYDIGLTRAEALIEADKPFWQA